MSLSQPDWALYRSFLAILRSGSLSEAARALGVAHPTIRRHLEELEGTLKQTLFTRSSTGLLPTELALNLRETAEAMESAAESFVRAASAKRSEVAGTVRISASEIIGVEVLPPILAELRQQNSGLAFELKASNAIDDVLRRDVDIAIRMTRPQQSNLSARKIGDVGIGLFAHAAWLAVNGEPKALTAVVERRQLIGYDRNPSIIRGLAARGIETDRNAFSLRTDSDLGQLSALRAGMGIGLCQLPLARRFPELRRVLPRFSAPLEVWLVSHPNMRASPRIRSTLDALHTGLRSYLKAK